MAGTCRQRLRGEWGQKGGVCGHQGSHGRVPAAAGHHGDLTAPAEDTSLAGFKDAAAAAVTAVADNKAAAPAKAPAKVSSAFTRLDSSSLKFF